VPTNGIGSETPSLPSTATSRSANHAGQSG
jgi:hypothetical protein